MKKIKSGTRLAHDGGDIILFCKGVVRQEGLSEEVTLSTVLGIENDQPCKDLGKNVPAGQGTAKVKS